MASNLTLQQIKQRHAMFIRAGHTPVECLVNLGNLVNGAGPQSQYLLQTFVASAVVSFIEPFRAADLGISTAGRAALGVVYGQLAAANIDFDSTVMAMVPHLIQKREELKARDETIRLAGFKTGFAKGKAAGINDGKLQFSASAASSKSTKPEECVPMTKSEVHIEKIQSGSLTHQIVQDTLDGITIADFEVDMMCEAQVGNEDVGVESDERTMPCDRNITLADAAPSANDEHQCASASFVVAGVERPTAESVQHSDVQLEQHNVPATLAIGCIKNVDPSAASEEQSVSRKELCNKEKQGDARVVAAVESAACLTKKVAQESVLGSKHVVATSSRKRITRSKPDINIDVAIKKRVP